MWPELSNSCLFWNVLTHFGHFFRVYLMCGNVLNLLLHICDQIWRNFASLGGFYLSILRLYLVSGKVLNILWHILMLLGNFSLLQMAKYEKLILPSGSTGAIAIFFLFPPTFWRRLFLPLANFHLFVTRLNTFFVVQF